MEKIFNAQLIAALFLAYRLCAANVDSLTLQKIERNPGIEVNFQDAPVFFKDNPLTGLTAFTVITPSFTKNQELERDVEKAIEKELKTVGEVIHLNDLDMRGFGTGNMVVIQIKDVNGWDGGVIDVSRISLQVQTSIIVNQTGLKTFPVVWAINSFFQGSLDSKSKDKMLKATQQLVAEFTQNYAYSNQGQNKKPIFYIYD